MLDVAEPSEPMSVGKFVDLAAPVVEDILARGKTAILAGGTGLYMDALIRAMALHLTRTRATPDAPGPGPAGGTEPLLEELRAVDPEAASRLHPPMRSGSSGPWRCTDRRGRL